jgi:hypothetical protein
MQDNRKEPRSPAYLGGRASFFDHKTSADCLIRNTSDAGALVRVAYGQYLPDEFELVIPQRDAVYRATARWRGPAGIGVELRKASGEAEGADSLSLMERLRRAERKNRKLKNRLAELGM